MHSQTYPWAFLCKAYTTPSSGPYWFFLNYMPMMVVKRVGNFEGWNVTELLKMCNKETQWKALNKEMMKRYSRREQGHLLWMYDVTNSIILDDRVEYCPKYFGISWVGVAQGIHPWRSEEGDLVRLRQVGGVWREKYDGDDSGQQVWVSMDVYIHLRPALI